MKLKTILWILLIALYAVYHFGFRNYGDTALYRINDSIAFELQPATDSFNGVTIRGYRKTSALVRFLCGACEVDYSEIDMPQANYRKDDWVYSGVPEHKTAKTDIVNLRTGETLNVEVPGTSSGPVDLLTLPEYRERGLQAGEQYKLKADFVKANFRPLSTYTGACIWIHIAFAILALFLIFPGLLIAILEAFANDDNDTGSYTDNI